MNITQLISKAKSLSGLKNRQDIITHALEFYVEHLKQQESDKKQSFYQATKHLAGSLEGASDLAHNKKYLKGFGE